MSDWEILGQGGLGQGSLLSKRTCHQSRRETSQYARKMGTFAQTPPLTHLAILESQCPLFTCGKKLGDENITKSRPKVHTCFVTLSIQQVLHLRESQNPHHWDSNFSFGGISGKPMRKQPIVPGSEPTKYGSCMFNFFQEVAKRFQDDCTILNPHQ